MTTKHDLKKLKHYLSSSTEDMISEFEFLDGLNYKFIDNNSSVLAVCHLDTVLDYKKVYLDDQVKIYTDLSDDIFINSVRLDDRLGLYIIIELLPQYGIIPDILLTLDEEIGISTAKNFNTTKRYNWMFQFDRAGRGGTVVMYDYETDNLYNILSDLDFLVESGSFSDICNLEHLGCAGFNFCCGYINEHTSNCISRLTWVETAVKMFVTFYDVYKDTCFVHIPFDYRFHRTSLYGKYTTTAATKNTKYGYCIDCGVALMPHEEEFEMCDDCQAQEDAWHKIEKDD